MTDRKLITHFFLYGEPPKPAGEHFAHLELLDYRSRPANWLIRPHVHRDLHHVFALEVGHGRADADGRMLEFRAPCIVTVPAGVVHGFRFQENSAGRVLTFSDPLLRLIASRASDLAVPFAESMWSAPYRTAEMTAALDQLELELSWAAPDHDFAVESILSTILVWVHRFHHCARQKSQTPVGPRAMLVARYRAFVEKGYREHPSVNEGARVLGVTPSVLRRACRELAGVSPGQILQGRLCLEAQRLMRYSNLTVSQIALQLGFEDPAYFSRFFTRMSGQSPRRFRDERRSAATH